MKYHSPSEESSVERSPVKATDMIANGDKDARSCVKLLPLILESSKIGKFIIDSSFLDKCQWE